MLGLGLNLGFSKDGTTLPLIDLSAPSNQVLSEGYGSFSEWTVNMRWQDGQTYNAGEILFLLLGTDANNFVQVDVFDNGDTFRLQIRSGGGTTYTYYLESALSFVLGQGDVSMTFTASDDLLTWVVNGIVVYDIATYDAMPVVDLTDICIGQNTGGGSSFSPTIREFQYYNRRLTHSQARALGRHSEYGITPVYSTSRHLVYSMGQSNSVGETSGDPGLTYTNAASMGLVKKDGIFDSTYQDPSADNGTGALFSNFSDVGVFSGVGTLLDDMVTSLGGTAAAMHVDRGGTGLVNTDGTWTWDVYDTSTSGITLTGVEVYQATLMQMVGAIHGVPYLRVWYQGEQDAKGIASSAVYQSELEDLLDFFDAHISMQTVIVTLGDLPAMTYPDRADVITAQEAVASSRSNTSFVAAEGLDREVDNIHLDEQGQQDLWSGISVSLGFSEPPGGGSDFTNEFSNEFN